MGKVITSNIDIVYSATALPLGVPGIQQQHNRPTGLGILLSLGWSTFFSNEASQGPQEMNSTTSWLCFYNTVTLDVTGLEFSHMLSLIYTW